MFLGPVKYVVTLGKKLLMNILHLELDWSMIEIRVTLAILRIL